MRFEIYNSDIGVELINYIMSFYTDKDLQREKKHFDSLMTMFNKKYVTLQELVKNLQKIIKLQRIHRKKIQGLHEIINLEVQLMEQMACLVTESEHKLLLDREKADNQKNREE